MADHDSKIRFQLHARKNGITSGTADVSDVVKTITEHVAGSMPALTTNERFARTFLHRYSPALDPQLALYAVITRSSDRLAFNRYNEFMTEVFALARGGDDIVTAARKAAGWDPGRRVGLSSYTGTRAYTLVREATEIFLQSQCGVWPTDGLGGPADPDDRAGMFRGRERRFGNEQFEPSSAAEEAARRLDRQQSDFTDRKLEAFWNQYVENVEGGITATTPYMDLILQKLRGVPITTSEAPGNTADPHAILELKLRNPPLIELIWSYWMEQGMLVQGINALALRFQNKRTADTDVLARFDVDPLRPLSNLLWGYIQDEHNRLTLARRSYEYDHQYGLRLHGRAVPPLQAADSRSRFLEAFHNLLRECARYYRAITNTFIVPDTYPALNALRELQIILSEGMHNQYGDLPSTARAEMMVQQWILSRPEMLQFVGQRTMVPHPEPWIGYVDTIRQLHGWGDGTCRHFRDLAICGERILLAVRFGNWAENQSDAAAALFMSYFREDVQTYIHAYRAVTGVDLSLEDIHARDPRLIVTQPSDLLLRRLPPRTAPAAALNGHPAALNGQAAPLPPAAISPAAPLH